MIMATIDSAKAEEIDNGSERPSELTELGLYRQIKDWFLGDSQHSAEWRKQAESNFDFIAGDQWEEKTKKDMIDQKRPPITFNLTLSVIKAVAGLEINGRHEIVYYPRGTEEGDVVANEALNGCSKWMGQNCDAEDEQSGAFEEVLICGMGWTESRMDYDEDPEGKYIEEKCDPIEMYWDRGARAKNLADAQRIYRVKKMSLGEARALAERIGAEDFHDEDLNASWAIGMDVSGKVRSTKDDNPSNGKLLDGKFDPKDDVYIVQCQWWEREKYNRVANPFTGAIEEMDDKGLADLNKRVGVANQRATQLDPSLLPGEPTQSLVLESVPATRKVFKQAFVGGKVLKSGPCPREDGFTFGCITGQLHKTKGTWFGLVTLIRDPQMMANKWLSNTTQILNGTAKGGIIAEKTAFGNDIRQAQKTYADPTAITFVEDKAISGGKIMAKPGVGIAAPYVQLMEYAVESIWRATGMNQEIMGMRDVNQPGVLEQQRKQAAMTILSTLFDSLRRYRKQIGRIRLYFIQNFLSDGRIIRILGDGGMKAVRILKDQTMGEYDVIVDDSPTSPNTKEQTFSVLSALLPMMRGKMEENPEAAAIFLEYSPLPSEAVEKLKKALLAPPSPEQQAAQRLQIEGTAAEVGKVKATTGKQKASAILDLARAAQIKAEADAQNLANSIIKGAPMINPLDPNPVIEPVDVGHNLPEPPPPPLVSGQPPAGMQDLDEMAALPPEQLNGAGPA